MNMRVLISSLVAAMCLVCSNAIACEDPEVAHPHSGQSGEMDSGAVVDIEIEMIKARVLRQCGLSSKLAENKLPWYFHYEYGLELINAGAASQAIEPLQMTANLKSKPGRSRRAHVWHVVR